VLFLEQGEMQVALVEQHGGTHTDNAADSEKQLQHFDPVKVARIRPGMYGRKADRGHHDQRGASAQQAKADRRGKDADQYKVQDRLTDLPGSFCTKRFDRN
jgi:hypothetical protein